jgi:hypothetical protein
MATPQYDLLARVGRHSDDELLRRDACAELIDGVGDLFEPFPDDDCLWRLRYAPVASAAGRKTT